MQDSDTLCNSKIIKSFISKAFCRCKYMEVSGIAPDRSLELWRRIFKPLYREYAAVARHFRKKIFIHSDGLILDILGDLFEIGYDAVNSQIFCMGIDRLRSFRGKITFWGEIDRQRTSSLRERRGGRNGRPVSLRASLPQRRGYRPM